MRARGIATLFIRGPWAGEAEAAPHEIVQFATRNALLHDVEHDLAVRAALRTYVAHPKTATTASLICTGRTIKTLPCEPLCQRCLSTAAEIRRVYKGEISRFGRGDWDQGRR